MTPPLRVRQSRLKAAGYLAATLPFVALGAWLCTLTGNVPIGIGIGLALSFGYHAGYFTMVLIRPSQMIFSEDGLRIEHGRGGPAWPWPTLVRARLTRSPFAVVQLETTDGKTPGVHSVWTLAPKQLVAEINTWQCRFGGPHLPQTPVEDAEAPEQRTIVS